MEEIILDLIIVSLVIWVRDLQKRIKKLEEK